MVYRRRIIGISLLSAVIVAVSALPLGVKAAPPIQNPKGGSLGLEARVPVDAPTTAPSISIPVNGQVFTQIPITVTGVCENDLLIKLFKNNVFAGSAECINGIYSITADLFSGQNDLVTRGYDGLDQTSPDSKTITVFYNDGSGGNFGSRVTLTSNYAKIGADPGQTLSWPFIISGGTGPYAISIDWGDGSTPSLISEAFPGEFTATHVYDKPGVYNVIVKVTDNNGTSAFLQVVGIGNGASAQSNGSTSKTPASPPVTVVKSPLWPFIVMAVLIFVAFWLGRRHELSVIRKRMSSGK